MGYIKCLFWTTTRGQRFLKDLDERVAEFTRLGLADRHFEMELSSCDENKAFQRLFELNLSEYLIDQGLHLESNDEGPDFKTTINTGTVWIEAVSPTMGQDPGTSFIEVQKADCVVEENPEIDILRRITSSLSTKSKKFKGDMDKGIVTHDDICIIAINMSPLGVYSDWSTKHSHAVFGALFNDSKSDPLNTKNGKPIPTDIFINNSHEHISAVLICRSGVQGIDSNHTSLFHNRYATNPLPLRKIQVSGEFYLPYKWTNTFCRVRPS